MTPQKGCAPSQAPPAAKTPAWGNTGVGTEAGKDGAAAPRTWRGVGAWAEDWGELNVGKRPPAVFVLDVGSGQGSGYGVQPVTALPDCSVGQPVWTPTGASHASGTHDEDA